MKTLTIIGLALLSSLFGIVGYCQEQKGQTLLGINKTEKFGNSVALSGNGNVLAVGSPRSDLNGIYEAGRVSIYYWDNTNWKLKGDYIHGDSEGDLSGWSVDLSHDGNTVIVGEVFNADNGVEAGQARVFKWDNDEWVQMGFDINSEAAGDYFGRAVSISGNGQVIAIGAERNDGNGENSGHVRVYSWDGFNWNKVGDDINGENPGDHSGFAVDLSEDGSTIAIGAGGHDGFHGNNTGHVRVFQWNGIEWKSKGELEGELEEENAGLAVSISDDGNIVAYGSPRSDVNGPESGQVTIYEWKNAWIMRGQQINGEYSGDEFGWSLEISGDGDWLVCGSPYNDGLGRPSGHVRVYRWNGENYIRAFNVIDSDNIGNRFGWSVAISANSGNTIAVGAPNDNKNGIDAGLVKCYELFPVSTKTYNSEYVDVYPNPFHDILSINSTVKIQSIKVYSSDGILVKQELYTNHGSDVININMGGLPAGIYILHIKSQEGNSVVKINKQ